MSSPVAAVEAYIRAHGPMKTSDVNSFYHARPDMRGELKGGLNAIISPGSIIKAYPKPPDRFLWMYIDDALSPWIKPLVAHASALETAVAHLKEGKPAKPEPVYALDPSAMQVAMVTLMSLEARVAELQATSSALDKRLDEMRRKAGSANTSVWTRGVGVAPVRASVPPPPSTVPPPSAWGRSAPATALPPVQPAPPPSQPATASRALAPPVRAPPGLGPPAAQAAVPPVWRASPQLPVARPSRPEVLSTAWEVECAWSVAGQSTTILLRNRTVKRHVALDCGGSGLSCPQADVVLITHGHVDHLGGIFVHARSRQTPATYLVPAEIMPHVVALRHAFEATDGHALPMNIRGVSPGEETDLGKGLAVVAVKTHHRVPSVGYLLYHVSRRLKAEFADLTNDEKAELGRRGEDLTEPVHVLEVAYSGDCVAASMDKRLLSAPLCIVEATFLGTEGEKDGEAAAAEHAHVLLSQLEARAAQVPDAGQNLMLCHFSARYSPTVIRERCAQASFWGGRPIALALRAFGASERAQDVHQDDVVWTL